jgi:hypothetical protein
MSEDSLLSAGMGSCYTRLGRPLFARVNGAAFLREVFSGESSNYLGLPLAFRRSGKLLSSVRLSVIWRRLRYNAFGGDGGPS